MKKRKNAVGIIVACLVTCASVLTAAGAILGGPLTNGANGHLYYLLSVNTWTGAEAEAQALGGHLATIRNATEDSWVFTNFGNFGSTPRYYWIGLNDAAQEGTFQWANGDTNSYRNWASGEPSSTSSTEDYVLVLAPNNSAPGKWNDAPNITNLGAAGLDIYAVAEVASSNLVIGTQPQNLSVTLGATAQFSVSVAGATPLFYQWRFNNADLGGATNATLTLSNVQFAQAGAYSVAVSNSPMVLVSSNAQLTVLSPVIGGPLTNSANGHVYYLLSVNTWTGAEAWAQMLGGHLATINDAAEDSWVFANFGNFGGTPRYYWIGLNDVALEGTFLWGNGDTNSYRNWSSGEPSGTSPTEDYVLVLAPNNSAPGKWNDAPNITNLGAAGLDIYAVMETVPPDCTAAPAGMVSWWRGEGNLLDEVGGNTAFPIGTVAYGAGEVGQAWVFNGSNTALRIPASSNLNIGAGGSITIEGWINPADVSGYHPIWEWNDGTNRSAIGVQVWIGQFPSDNGVLFVNLTDSSNTSHTISSATGTLVTNVFQHIAVTYDREAGTATLYRNGSVVAQSVLGSFTPQTGFDLWMGDRPNDRAGDTSFDRHFAGLIDETGLYNRALTSSEVLTIYTSGLLGKCMPTNPVPAIILTQPAGVSVVAGSSAGFSVQATGTATLAYQWHFGSNDVAGATNASLLLTNVQLAQAGSYSVTVANPYGTTNSASATLTVTLPPALVSLVPTTGEAGGMVSIPVLLRANGNENTVGFSVTFATNRLTLDSVELGINAAGASLNVNSNSAGSGRVGVLLALPFGTSFTPGTQEVARINFLVAPITTSATTALTFTDTPIARQLVSAVATILPATYSNASVTITNVGFEGDVSPRGAVDNAVTAVDWVQVGRLVVGLDTIASPAEFQRVDCAPRATKGDGHLKLTDWVQAGRYASGLDTLTSVGGPTSGPGAAAAPSGKTTSLGPVRTLRMNNGVLTPGQASTIAVQLLAQGNENAASASISYNAAVLRLNSITLGSDAAGAQLIPNTNTLGKIAFMLALPSGQTFAAGTRQIVNLNFAVVPEATGIAPITFVNVPLPSQLSDALANDLAASYEDGLLTLDGPPPTLRIDPAVGGAMLSWPITAPGYMLEAIANWAPTNVWSNVPTPPAISGAEQQVTVPVDPPLRIFRLKRP